MRLRMPLAHTKQHKRKQLFPVSRGCRSLEGSSSKYCAGHDGHQCCPCNDKGKQTPRRQALTHAVIMAAQVSPRHPDARVGPIFGGHPIEEYSGADSRGSAQHAQTLSSLLSSFRPAHGIWLASSSHSRFGSRPRTTRHAHLGSRPPSRSSCPVQVPTIGLRAASERISHSATRHH
jgi:hypothetical protein